VSVQSGDPFLIFDGDCGFCSAVAARLSSLWTEPGQTISGKRLGIDELRTLGLTDADVRRAAYWVEEGGRLFRGHAAIAKALTLGGPAARFVGRTRLIPPISWLARSVYWLIARYRYRLPVFGSLVTAALSAFWPA
jgi:predicted DCC family thiol-disulfide oxidoreductase YuxK